MKNILEEKKVFFLSYSQADVKQPGGDCSELAHDPKDGEDLQVCCTIILATAFRAKLCIKLHSL